MKWFKFYGQDWLTDTKIMDLSSVERLCWITILCLASDDEKGDGVIHHLTEDKLFRLSSIPQDLYTKNRGILVKLEALGMIQNDNGDNKIRVINFKKRQNKHLSGYERVKRYRDKKRVNTRVKNDNGDNARDNANDNARLDKNRIDKNREERYPLSWIKKLDSTSISPFVEKYEIEERGVRRVASDLVLWCESKEKTFKNYRAALEKWISKDCKLRSEVRSNKL